MVADEGEREQMMLGEYLERSALQENKMLCGEVYCKKFVTKCTEARFRWSWVLGNETEGSPVILEKLLECSTHSDIRSFSYETNWSTGMRMSECVCLCKGIFCLVVSPTACQLRRMWGLFIFRIRVVRDGGCTRGEV